MNGLRDVKKDTQVWLLGLSKQYTQFNTKHNFKTASRRISPLTKLLQPSVKTEGTV